jgi:hypothetical protein
MRMVCPFGLFRGIKIFSYFFPFRCSFNKQRAMAGISLATRDLRGIKVFSHFFPTECSLGSRVRRRTFTMKELTTVSCRLGGQHCDSTFSFSRPLPGVAHDYFKEHRWLLAMREGEVSMKDPNHRTRHPRSHLGDQASAQGTRGCAWRDDQFGRGQNTGLGWSDPTFAHVSVAKVNHGSLQPNKNFLRCAR